MPRVHRQKKSRAGKERRCGAIGCGVVIEPGTEYLKWEFRYGGAHYRCLQHPPKRSELTQSKMSQVYAAIEGAESDIAGAETVEEIRDALIMAGEAAQEVADEYREAAEPFGGEGENAERADEVEAAAEELQGFDADDDDIDTARDDASALLADLAI